MATATEVLTDSFKARQNRDAARIAALVALYYRSRVDVSDPTSIERWLAIVVPRLISASDSGARLAQAYVQAIHDLEVGLGGFSASATLGTIDEGVRNSLLTVGPYSYTNKAVEIRRLDVPDRVKTGLLRGAKEASTKAIAASAIRHAQAGARQTVFDNVLEDKTALGYVRVTSGEPCSFCAMLASRGLQYRSYKADSFDISNQRFTGDGSAKVHDNCGCSLKPVYTKIDPLVDRTKEFADLWERWGAGGQGETNASLRFRRGYDHWRRTGEFLTWEQADAD